MLINLYLLIDIYEIYNESFYFVLSIVVIILDNIFEPG